jgi:hypothetical protein
MFMTAAQVQELFAISAESLPRLGIPCVRFGRVRRYSYAAIKVYLDGRGPKD